MIASRDEDAIAAEVTAQLGDRVVGRFRDVVQHVPNAKAAAAVELAASCDADAVLTIGGGSATGFGKVVCLDSDAELAFVCIPTTYAGSEMTTIWGRTDGDHKQTGKNPVVKPDTVIYDPDLTASLPARIAGPSGMNALAHCVEALYGPGANPVVALSALEGIRVLNHSLPIVCDGAADASARAVARSDVLFGAHLAGVALAAAGTALHHKTCHVLGGMFDLNHGDMNAVVLGHALAYNAPAIPSVMQQIATALGVGADAAPKQLIELARMIGAPSSLEAIGMPEDGIEDAARRVVAAAHANVRPPELDGITAMLADAFAGRDPR